METVTIDGVEYVKASVLAKRHRYTSDYIGQLCRSKKVDAHLVGRTWYVYPPSLEGHKSTRYAELRSGEKNQNEVSNTASSRVEVEAPIKKTLLRAQSPHFHDRVYWKGAAYESDDAALLPQPDRKTEARPLKMPIRLAESERVRVASVSKNVSMVSQPLPAIALSGTLKVRDYSPDFELHDGGDSQENAVKHSDSVSEAPADNELKPSGVELDSGNEVPAKGSAFLRRLEPKEALHTRPGTGTAPAMAGDIHPPHHKSSASVVLDAARPLTVAKQPSTPEDPRTSLFFKLVIAPAVTMLVVGVAATLLVVENVTVVGGGQEAASLRFDPSLLVTFFTGW